MKPNCKASYILQRHHIRHQAMWLGVWAGRRKGEKKYNDFINRYYEFHPLDCADLCDSHHAEIHKAYDEIIAQDIAELGVPMSKFSWDQAHRLMDKLEKHFWEWVATKTPGISSKNYGRTVKKRRAILKEKYREGRD